MKLYIVDMGATPRSRCLSRTCGAARNEEDDETERRTTYHNLLTSCLGSSQKAADAMVHPFTGGLYGFIAALNEDQAELIRKNQKVMSVCVNVVLYPQTIISLKTIQLETNGEGGADSLLVKANYGENMIIGCMDSGVSLDSPSFNDEGYGEPPPNWRGGDHAYPFGGYRNKKLLAVRCFNVYKMIHGCVDHTWQYGLDDDGHGTHTLSTAAGNVYLSAYGTVQGVAPRARAASYKVLWKNPLSEEITAYNVDIYTAIDVAISDGVDVLNISMGPNFRNVKLSDQTYFEHGISRGAFSAVVQNISVVCAAGNAGPDPYSVVNNAPWLTTVGAVTVGRIFTSLVRFQDGTFIKGIGLFEEPLEIPEDNRFAPLVFSENASYGGRRYDAALCKYGSLDHARVNGNILICSAGGVDIESKACTAKAAGAVGLIVVNQKEMNFDESSLLSAAKAQKTLRTLLMSYKQGLALIERSSRAGAGELQGRFEVFAKSTTRGPVLANFSSRGPCCYTPHIIKPDVVAPGVSIIAAYGPNYIARSGTSMAAPQVAGVMALIKSEQPTWSEAARKSAIMTTAKRETILTEWGEDATPYGIGAGLIQCHLCLNPGLIYELTIKDYMDYWYTIGFTEVAQFMDNVYTPNLICLQNFNYPSIWVALPGLSVEVSRRLTNVGERGDYTFEFIAPNGVDMVISPTVLQFKEVGDIIEYKITFTRNAFAVEGEEVFGEIIWFDGEHSVRSVIAVSLKAKTEA